MIKNIQKYVELDSPAETDFVSDKPLLFLVGDSSKITTFDFASLPCSLPCLQFCNETETPSSVFDLKTAPQHVAF